MTSSNIKYYALVLTFLSYSIELKSQIRKNELFFVTGYSQSCQLKYNDKNNLSYWRNNIHNIFFGTEYYRNLKKVSIGVGLNLVEKGLKNEYTQDYYGYKYTVGYFYSLNFIESPIYLRINRKKFDLAFNMYNSFLFNASQGALRRREYADGTIIETKGTTKADKIFKKYEFGLGAKLCYKLNKILKISFSGSTSLRRLYIYPSGELNYNTTFLIGINYNILK